MNFDNIPLPPLVLILGGARSGKSVMAETWVVAEAERRKTQATYLASGQAWDQEMKERVTLHKERRGRIWQTIEEPLDVAKKMPSLPQGQPILFDCLTMWLTNHLLAEHDLTVECETLIKALQSAPAPIVCVSNEVGLGVVPDNALSRNFRDAQGRLNQMVAAIADRVVLVAAGLPLVLKSEI